MTAAGCTLVPVRSVEAVCEPYGWAWPAAHEAEIARHWEARRAATPELFNGPVLLSSGHRIEEGVLKATYFRTDYRTFLAFRDFGFPDPGVRNGFAMPALRDTDGAFLLGVMGHHTANAGRIYFPAGTPDLDDLRPDGTVDLAGSIGRELAEETGLTTRDYALGEGWTLVLAEGMAALLRPVVLARPADEIASRIREAIGAEERPELSGCVVVRSVSEIDAERMPVFIQAYLRDAFAGR